MKRRSTSCTEARTPPTASCIRSVTTPAQTGTDTWLWALSISRTTARCTISQTPFDGLTGSTRSALAANTVGPRLSDTTVAPTSTWRTPQGTTFRVTPTATLTPLFFASTNLTNGNAQGLTNDFLATTRNNAGVLLSTSLRSDRCSNYELLDRRPEGSEERNLAGCHHRYKPIQERRSLRASATRTDSERIQLLR